MRDLLGYGAGPGMVFPYIGLNGDDGYARVKIDHPGPDGKKYRAPKGQANRLYITPLRDDPRVLTDVTIPLWVTEGEKKAAKACQEGLVCIGLAGVWCWRTRGDDGASRPIDDLDLILWQGRTVYIVFDSDLATNPKVRAAERALAAELRRRGATVFAVHLPGGPSGEKVGLDDYLITHSVEALCMIEPTPIDDDEPSVWPDPQPVPDALPPVPAFDAARLLPAVFATWVEDVAERAQCPPDYVGVGAVVSAAATIGRQIGIRPKVHDDWTVTPNLWGLLIGPPGLMKSAAMKESHRGVSHLLALARERYQQVLKDHDFHALAAQSRRDAVEAQMKAAAKRGEPIERFREALEAAAEPEAPIERRYIVNDATVEKLGALLNDNTNGLLILRDEISGFLRTMDREGHENDRAFHCECWNGDGAYTYDRIGRGTLHIAAACTSILGGIQPLPLGAYLREAFRNGQDDGLIQRFQLAVYPDISPTWQNHDRAPNSDARQRIIETFEGLDRLDARDIGAHRESRTGRSFLHFTPEAQERFDAWRSDLETRIRAAQDHPVLISHLSKYRSLLPSLALIFHLIECVDRGIGGPVSEPATTRAIAWCAYLEPHARRVYEAVIAPGRLATATLAKKLPLLSEIFTAREVGLKGWAGLTEPDDIALAVGTLESLHWLRAVRPPRSPQGGRSTIRYRRNPKIRGATT